MSHNTRGLRATDIEEQLMKGNLKKAIAWNYFRSLELILSKIFQKLEMKKDFL